jgi:methionyl-tRNA synthetase
LRNIIGISRLGNKYFNKREPWTLIKTDRVQAANAVYVAVQIVKTLATTLEPFIPFTAKKLAGLLNLAPATSQEWDKATKLLPEGHHIQKATPIFSKIEANAEELQHKLEKIEKTKHAKPPVSFQEFANLDLRVGRIVKAESVPKSKNLVKLNIDIGAGEVKQAVAGIASQYTPNQLEGKNIAVLANLEPKRIFGLDSEVMILAAEDGDTIAILLPDKPVMAGSRIK